MPSRATFVAQLPTGVALPYVVAGDPAGTPTLLLHPWGESLHAFDRLVPQLPASIRAFAMDQRGHGDADKPDTGYALGDYAADVVAFLDVLGISAAVLVGSSSGGYVAQQVAAENPERVLGLVLVGAPRSLQGRRPEFADEVDRLVDPVDPDWVQDSLAWFPLHRPVPAWYLEDRVTDGVRMPARVWQQALAGLIEAEPPTRAGSIRAPTMVIWGQLDELIPAADAKDLAAAIPGAALLVYEGTGHLVLWEAPSRVADDIARFVGQACTRA